MRIDIDAIERRKKGGLVRDKVFPLYRQEITSAILYHYIDGKLFNAQTFDDPKAVIHLTVMIDKKGEK